MIEPRLAGERKPTAAKTIKKNAQKISWTMDKGRWIKVLEGVLVGVLGITWCISS